MNRSLGSEVDFPLVSVIMPTYNRASYIYKSIRSILNQNYPNLELIVIDDGSEDNTEEIITTIKDNRLKLIRLFKNNGPGYARNVGIKNSKGDFIAFADSDDIWLPNKLITQIEALKLFPDIDILFADYLNINYVTGEKGNGFLQNKAGFETLKTQQLRDAIYLIVDGMAEAILKANFIAPSTVVVRSDIFITIGGFLPRLIGTEDYEFWFRAIASNLQFGYINEILIERHKDHTSISTNILNSGYYILQALDICQSIILRENNYKLLREIKNRKRLTWQSLIKEYAKIGRKRQAWNAFIKCLHHGLSLRPFLYLGAALCGPRLIDKIKKIKTHLV